MPSKARESLPPLPSSAQRATHRAPKASRDDERERLLRNRGASPIARDPEPPGRHAPRSGSQENRWQTAPMKLRPLTVEDRDRPAPRGLARTIELAQVRQRPVLRPAIGPHRFHQREVPMLLAVLGARVNFQKHADTECLPPGRKERG